MEIVSPMNRISLCILCIASGCWKPPLNSLPDSELNFHPFSGDLFENWIVETIDMPLICPDGALNTLTLVRPTGDITPNGTAIVFHPTSFDFGYVEMGAKKTFQDPVSLSRDWALRRVYSTLGMYQDGIGTGTMDGSIPQALVEQNIQLVLPGNCWGDLWHNGGDQANDVALDGFNRLGFDAVQWTLSVTTDATFAAEVGIIDAALWVTNGPLYGIGLAEGGRAVGEVLTSSVPFDGILIDSSPDNPNGFNTDPSTYAQWLEGLERIFPDDADWTEASLGRVPALPPRVSYLYSSLDPVFPVNVHESAVSRLTSEQDALVIDTNERTHIQAGDTLSLAREAVAHTLNVPIFEEASTEE